MRIPTDRPQMRFLFPHKKHYPKGTDKAMENNGKKIIYADNAATTAVSPAVLEAMLPYYTECYGNPSSLYALGTAAKKPLEEARAKSQQNVSVQSRMRSTSQAAAAKATTGPLRAQRTRC